jgi:ubiquinone/menaquinone biosynthesis C-methylase UbiE
LLRESNTKERLVNRFIPRLAACAALFLLSLSAAAPAQDKSVKPGINDPFKDPNVKEYQGKFEVESREVYSSRKEIVAACHLKPGMVVGDVGAGTGLFTRLFADEVGPKGKVYAVDIADKFLDHIKKTAKEQRLNNIATIKATDVSSELPANSCDLVFICDTYHHFEYPHRTMTTIHKALKPGGRLIVIDFHRIPGKSREFVLGHVRAGQEVFEKEIIESGFKKVGEDKELLKENYLVRFEKAAKSSRNEPRP